MTELALTALRVVNVAAAVSVVVGLTVGAAYVARWILTPPPSYTPPRVEWTAENSVNRRQGRR